MPNQEFHLRATAWLRDEMSFETKPSHAVAAADPTDPTLRRVIGSYVPPEAQPPSSAVAVIMLFVAAGIAAMLAARSGVSSEIVFGSRIVAFLSVATAVGVLISDARRKARVRERVEVLIHSARRGAAPLDAARTADAIASMNARLWIVSEVGFSPEAHAVAQRSGARCFVLRGGRIVQVERR